MPIPTDRLPPYTERAIRNPAPRTISPTGQCSATLQQYTPPSHEIAEQEMPHLSRSMQSVARADGTDAGDVGLTAAQRRGSSNSSSTILPSYAQASPWGRYASEAEYLAALRAWADGRRFVEPEGKGFAYYGAKSMKDYEDQPGPSSVSYTHLTLPTIYSV